MPTSSRPSEARDTGSPGAGVIGRYDLVQCRCWVLNFGLLQEYHMLLTSEPSFQSSFTLWHISSMVSRSDLLFFSFIHHPFFVFSHLIIFLSLSSPGSFGALDVDQASLETLICPCMLAF